MSWVQENKFTAALAGVSVVGAGVLLTLAMSKGSDFDTANTRLKKALKQEQELRTADIYPSAANLKELKLNVDGLAKSSRQLQQQFEFYRPKPEEVADFAAESFGAMVSEYKHRLDEKFEAQGIALPENVIYGFEDYVSKSPKPAATGELKYQKQALEWLFKQLANSQPEALLNVVRPKLEIEKRTGPRNTKINEKAAYVVMPLELTFTADEEAYKTFLEAISNSKKYAFTVRYMRLQNEKQLPPTVKDAQFAAAAQEPEAEPAGFGGFDGFAEAGGGEVDAQEVEMVGEKLPEVASDSDTTRILSPVLGEEKVNVFLKLDLILLKNGSKVSLDEAKENAGVKTPAKKKK